VRAEPSIRAAAAHAAAHARRRRRLSRAAAFTGQRQIANWDLGGSAEAHRSFVRLTAEVQGSKGWLTSQQPLHLSEWSAMLELRASGASPHLYGDGLAIWLVKSSDHVEGPVFGREDKWKGLGIFFDTFQNVDHSHHHKHPYAARTTRTHPRPQRASRRPSALSCRVLARHVRSLVPATFMR
jgi:hypothetical protein